MKASTLLLPLFQFTLSVFLFNRLVYMFSERKCKLEREREIEFVMSWEVFLQK